MHYLYFYTESGGVIVTDLSEEADPHRHRTDSRTQCQTRQTQAAQRTNSPQQSVLEAPVPLRGSLVPTVTVTGLSQADPHRHHTDSRSPRQTRQTQAAQRTNSPQQSVLGSPASHRLVTRTAAVGPPITVTVTVKSTPEHIRVLLRQI